MHSFSSLAASPADRCKTQQQLLAKNKEEIQDCLQWDPFRKMPVKDAQGNYTLKWPLDKMSELTVEEFGARTFLQDAIQKQSAHSRPLEYSRSEPKDAIAGMEAMLDKDAPIRNKMQLLQRAANVGSVRLFERLLRHNLLQYGAYAPPEKIKAMLRERRKAMREEYSKVTTSHKPILQAIVSSMYGMERLNRTYAKVSQFLEKLCTMGGDTLGLRDVKNKLRKMMDRPPEERIGMTDHLGEYREYYPMEAIAHYAGGEYLERARQVGASVEPEYSIQAMGGVLKQEVPLTVQLDPSMTLQSIAMSGSDRLFSLMLEHNIKPADHEGLRFILDNARQAGREDLKRLDSHAGPVQTNPKEWEQWMRMLSKRLDVRLARMEELSTVHEKVQQFMLNLKSKVSETRQNNLLAELAAEQEKEKPKSKTKSARRKARLKEKKAQAATRPSPPAISSVNTGLPKTAPHPSRLSTSLPVDSSTSPSSRPPESPMEASSSAIGTRAISAVLPEQPASAGMSSLPIRQEAESADNNRYRLPYFDVEAAAAFLQNRWQEALNLAENPNSGVVVYSSGTPSTSSDT